MKNSVQDETEPNCVVIVSNHIGFFANRGNSERLTDSASSSVT